MFDYGHECEVFGEYGHRIPLEGYWQAGEPSLASQAFICSSAMEALAFLSLNQHRFPNFDRLLFTTDKSRKGKTGLIFGNDILGRITDIKTAAPQALINYEGAEQYSIQYHNQYYAFSENNLTLNAFEKASHQRFGLRTWKPKKHSSYLAQLQWKPSTSDPQLSMP
jgi:hypothetical protein